MEADPAKTVDDTSDPIDIDSDDELLDPFSDQPKGSGDVLTQPGSDMEKKEFKTKKPTTTK